MHGVPHRLPVNMKLAPRLFGMLGDEYCCDRVCRRWRILALFSSDDLHENKIERKIQENQNENKRGEERESRGRVDVREVSAPNLFGVFRKVLIELLSDSTNSAILAFCRARFDESGLAITLPDVRRLVMRMGGPPPPMRLEGER